MNPAFAILALISFVQYRKCSISCYRYLQWMISFPYLHYFQFFDVYFHIIFSSNFDDSMQHRLQFFFRLGHNYKIVCILYGIDLLAFHYKVSDVLHCLLDEPLSIKVEQNRRHPPSASDFNVVGLSLDPLVYV
uniref:Putative secreted protein n=1 Tax=Xenopsylla cheopis TaxID=163159 RepID=A0A6M2E0K0_XENCH